MNKVYFSNNTVKNLDKWNNTGGHLRVFVYPSKWWSIKEWKVALMFMRDFTCHFDTYKHKE